MPFKFSNNSSRKHLYDFSPKRGFYTHDVEAGTPPSTIGVFGKKLPSCIHILNNGGHQPLLDQTVSKTGKTQASDLQSGSPLKHYLGRRYNVLYHLREERLERLLPFRSR